MWSGEQTVHKSITRGSHEPMPKIINYSPQIFPFKMIRYAAVDLRAPIRISADGMIVGRMPDDRFPVGQFSGAISWKDAKQEALTAIRNVLDALIARREIYAVLIPLECGEFQNPAEDIGL